MPFDQWDSMLYTHRRSQEIGLVRNKLPGQWYLYTPHIDNKLAWQHRPKPSIQEHSICQYFLESMVFRWHYNKFDNLSGQQLSDLG
jgi:hypothetical protein